MKRKIAAGTLAVALAVGGLVWASPAMAEEVVNPEPEVTQTQAPVEESAPAEGPAESTVAPLTDKGDHTEKKVYVCKYVGTPGVDERLQTGQNPIEVSVNAIKNWDGTVPGWFADAHDRSYVLAYVGGHPPYQPTIEDCPAPQEPEPVKVTPPTPTFEDPCGVNNLTVATAETKGIVWSVNQIGNKTKVAAAAAEGYVLEGTTTWEFTDSGVLCPPTNVVCEANEQGPVGTNLNGLWTNVDTRSAGHYEYVDGALHVWTDDATSNAKVSLGTAASFALSQSGQFGIDWEGTTPPPGVNLFVDFDNDGSIDGTLVFETVYGQDLWLTNGSKQFVKDAAPSHTGGNGSENHGTINEWLTVFPNAQVKGIAFSLGSGVHGDGLIKSLTIGCTVYTFDFQEVVVEPEPEVVTLGAPVIQDKCGTSEDYGFKPEDTEGVTYEWADAEDESNLDIRAVVAEGYVVEDVPEGWASEGEGSYIYVWTYEFTNEACPTTPENPTPATPAPAGTKATPVALASTGGGDVNPILPIAGGLTVALGITLMLMRRLARR